MNDKSFKEFDSMGDQTLAQHIGEFIRHHRLQQNKTQKILASEAGISRSTLSLLERGEPVTLATLIQVLRILDQLQIMDAFTVQQNISPLTIARLEKKKRKRAARTKDKQTNKTDW